MLKYSNAHNDVFENNIKGWELNKYFDSEHYKLKWNSQK